MSSLKNKVALITGGSRGIGAEIARHYAAEGATVAITYGKSAADAAKVVAGIESKGGKARAYQADATNPGAMQGLVDSIVRDIGPVDILVNNAGVWSMGAIGEINPDEYNRVMDVNVNSVFTLTNAVVKTMKPGSRIINISSGLGERASGPGMSTYVGSKFAVSGLTRGWAKDLGARSILVNAILPGPINTEMNPENGDFADYQKAQTALGRYGQPDEIAAVAVFLAGPGASYITGATLPVDGGWNA